MSKSKHEIFTLLIGETGSGKSTFINYLANFFKGGSLTQLRIAIPTRYHDANMHLNSNEHAVNDVTQSKTTECQQYSFELKNVIFNFIDTPGINDTGGLLKDSKNIEKIFTRIQELPYINSIIFIMNGAVSRATINVQNVLTKFEERLPDSVYKNMIIILTNCQSHTVNFHPNKLGFPVTSQEFYMQNSAFSSSSSLWSRKTKELMDYHFQTSMSTINNIIEILCNAEPQSIKDFKNMNDDRNTIRRELHDTRLALLDLQSLEDELVLLEESSNIYANNAAKFQDFIHHKTVTRMDRIQTEYHSTLCSKCSTVCHERCNLKEIPRAGTQDFIYCLVLQSGYCSRCPRQCGPQTHYHDRSILLPTSVKVEEVIQSRFQRYNEEKAGQEKVEIKCNDLQKTKQFIEDELEKQYLKIKDAIQRLQQTCSRVNVTDEIVEFVNCLKKEIKSLRSPLVFEKAKNFISILEHLSNEPTNQRILQAEASESLVSAPGLLCSVSKEEQSVPYGSSRKKKSKPESTEKKQKTISTSSLRNSTPAIDKQEKISRVSSCEDSNEEFYPAESNPIHNYDNLRGLPERDEKEPSTSEVIDVRYSNNREPDYKSYTLENLIKESKSCKSKLILRELRLRSAGKSVGLLTTDELIDVCEYFSSNRQKPLTDLIVLKEQMDNEILEKIDEDPFNIEVVNRMTLLRLVAVNMLIIRMTRDPVV